VRDLRDTMIAGIALAHHAALIGCETCCVGVLPCDPGVIRSFLHRPDCSQAKQTVVGRDQRKVREQWRTETDLRDRVVGSTSHPRDRADRPAAPAAISATAQEWYGSLRFRYATSGPLSQIVITTARTCAGRSSQVCGCPPHCRQDQT
jgi:hypothetical protein